MGGKTQDGAQRIVRERDRQIAEEGWDAAHDDEEHPRGELAVVAALYASPVLLFEKSDLAGGGVLFADPWPWAEKHDKRPRSRAGELKENKFLIKQSLGSVFSVKARVRQLEKAGALIAAEIDRLLRAVEDEED